MKNLNNIFILGDSILDTYVYGNVKRISPEAPVPVFNENKRLDVLGGSSNVSYLINKYTDNVLYYSVFGIDKVSKKIISLLKKNKISCEYEIDKDYIASNKIRYISNDNQMVFRKDLEKTLINKNIIKKLIHKIKIKIKKNDILIISDYNKGVITDEIVNIISYAKKINSKVIIDPKKNDWSIYKNSYLIKPNKKEFSEVLEFNKFENNNNFKLNKKYKIKNILVTSGKKGMKLYNDKSKIDNYDTFNISVSDVTGAGDVALSTICLLDHYKFPLIDSIKFANFTSSLSVSKFGSNNIDLLSAIKKCSPKYINDIDYLLTLISPLRKSHTIGFTNGCFDIIHPGHIHLLKECRKNCDILILAINSDGSVKKNKGNSRPYNKLNDRVKMLLEFELADFIITFDEKTPLNLIKKIKPKILFKGSDYKISKIIGYKFLKSINSRIMTVDLLKNYSSSKLIEKVS